MTNTQTVIKEAELLIDELTQAYGNSVKDVKELQDRVIVLTDAIRKTVVNARVMTVEGSITSYTVPASAIEGLYKAVLGDGK